MCYAKIFWVRDKFFLEYFKAEYLFMFVNIKNEKISSLNFCKNKNFIQKTRHNNFNCLSKTLFFVKLS